MPKGNYESMKMKVSGTLSRSRLHLQHLHLSVRDGGVARRRVAISPVGTLKPRDAEHNASQRSFSRCDSTKAASGLQKPSSKIRNVHTDRAALKPV